MMAVSFYVADSSDPIIQTYSDIFPGLLHEMSEMPDYVKAHIRYPQIMFDIQGKNVCDIPYEQSRCFL